jgi:hypothetical protein
MKLRALGDARSRRCPDDGMLRASLEPSGVPAELQAHLAACAHCQLRLADMSDAARAADELLGRLPSPAVDVNAAWRRMNTRIYEENAVGAARKGNSYMAMLANARWMRAGGAVAAVLALVVVFTLSPMRSLADGMLNSFRVEKFAAITIPTGAIDPANLSILGGIGGSEDNPLTSQLGELGTFETSFTMDSLRQVSTLDEAETHYGADLDTPDDLPDAFNVAPEIWVTDDGTATYTLNVGPANELIDELGLPIYSLPDPAVHPTVPFTVELSKAVVLNYESASGERLFVGQTRSPELSFPDWFNADDLREELLQIPLLPADTLAQLRAIDDWQHTVIIPVPENADTDDVTVNGKPGLKIEMADGHGAGVVWVDDGYLYVVAGQLSGNDVLDIADSMD